MYDVFFFCIEVSVEFLVVYFKFYVVIYFGIFDIVYFLDGWCGFWF